MAKNSNGKPGGAPPPSEDDDDLSFLYEEAAKDTPDLGTSEAPEDNLVPLVYILQPLSPQVQERDPDNYIKGAKPGSIWLRNAPDPIVDGDEGILFQPCLFSRDWIEWVPRKEGGGFVARHPQRPPDAVEVEDDDNGRVVFKMRNGNEVIEVRYHTGFVHRGDARLPFVIPMTSTGHTVSKQWIFNINQRRLPNGMRAKSYMGLYRLTTKLKKNKKGQWFAFSVAEEGFITKKDMQPALTLQETMRLGTRQIETPQLTHYDTGQVDQQRSREQTSEQPAEEAPM